MGKSLRNVKPGIVLKNENSRGAQKQSITILKFNLLGELLFDLEAGTVWMNILISSNKDMGKRENLVILRSDK